MSRDWTTEELQAASEAMKAMGHMGYKEFCESLKEVRRMELRDYVFPDFAYYWKLLLSSL